MTFRKFATIVLFCLFGILISAVQLVAQVLPNPEAHSANLETAHRDSLWNNYRVEQEIRQFREQPSGIAISSPQAPPVLDGLSDEKIFALRQVIFENPPISISQNELDAVAQRYIFQEQVSLRDLYEMLAEIDALFDARHVIGRAVLPVQDVEDGIVYVQIIEGKFGATTIDIKRQPFFPEWQKKDLIPVNRLFGRNFVENQVRFQRGAVLNVKNLEEEILRFNRKFRTQLLAELEPGDDLGTSNLKLTAVAPQPVSGGFYCDSSGRETSGRIRNGYFVQLQSLAGIDESFFCSYDTTEGTSYLTMFGDMPVSPFGTSFEMGYDYGTPKTLYGPLAGLNITGTSQRYRPGIRQLLRNTKEHRTDVSVQYEGFESDTSFDGFVNYREKVTSGTFGISDTYRTKNTVRFLSLNWQTGRAGVAPNPIFGDFTHQNFHTLQGGLTKVWYPDKNWTFLVKSNGQLALSPLSQSRIFQMGGMATVRGAPEGLITGDSGYVINLEARRLIGNWNNKAGVEAFTFFDHGGVFYRTYPEEYHPSDYLFSVGTGLNMNLGRYVSATIGYGQPIFTAESHRDDYRDKLRHGNGYFTIRAQF